MYCSKIIIISVLSVGFANSQASEMKDFASQGMRKRTIDCLSSDEDADKKTTRVSRKKPAWYHHDFKYFDDILSTEIINNFEKSVTKNELISDNERGLNAILSVIDIHHNFSNPVIENKTITDQSSLYKIEVDKKPISRQSLCNGDHTVLQPLHHAAQYHATTDIAHILLKNGANVNKQDSTGKYPFDYALKNTNSQFVHLFVKYGVNQATSCYPTRFKKLKIRDLQEEGVQSNEPTEIGKKKHLNSSTNQQYKTPTWFDAEMSIREDEMVMNISEELQSKALHSEIKQSIAINCSAART